MTHPPATCELCGGTGLYSPSALPCPKGCKDIVERLVKIAEASRRENGSLIPLGQEIADAVEYITNMLAYISDLEQREKDARVKALELAAVHAECHSDDRRGRDRNFDWNDGYIDGCRGAAAAIRALKDELR